MTSKCPSASRIDTTTDREAGLSLIELIMYMLLASLLLGGMATLLANSWTTQTNVQTMSDATNRGQIVSQSIERAMRNAQAFDVSASGGLLRVDTNLSGDQRCQAFWVSSGALYQTSTWGTRADGTADPIPSLNPASWPKPWLTEGVKQRASTIPFFARSGLNLSYAFDVDLATDTAAPVRFKGQVSLRTPEAGGVSPCWS
ncbi:hypothetical protein Q9S36_28200 [Microbacterium sp. ARD31]|uniref:PilW family protein n=1 Tax=Microbacterium sp. ARD31 TaxID=2962576 RepID=UPI00288158DE|nr:hypothetical protein [Microbacterium sp. ARD31]MDT0184080.1 hypothetical protein [Microbacterium sp. ARD31]